MSGLGALVRFEARRALRDPLTWAGVLAFLVVLAIGHAAHWRAPGAPEDDRLFGYAYIAALLLAGRMRLAEDRERGFDEFVAVDLASPAAYVAAKVLAVLGGLVVFGGAAFAAALAVSGGDPLYAGWYTVLFTLIASLFLPVLLLAEAVVDTRFPVAVVLIAFFCAIGILTAFHDPATVLRILGFDVRRFQFETLGPLLIRTLLLAPLLTIVAGAGLARRLRGDPRLRMP